MRGGVKGFVEPRPEVAMREQIHAEQGDEVRQRPAASGASSCRYSQESAWLMSAVQSWVWRALAEVPTKVFTRQVLFERP